MSVRLSFRDRVAALFRAHPGQWIDADRFVQIGGRYASRTRISDCRTELGMRIDNRVRRQHGIAISEYMYVPDPAPASEPIGHDLNSGFQLR